MAFPLEYKGKIKLGPRDSSGELDCQTRFLEEFAKELKLAKAFDIAIAENQVSFRSGIFGSFNNWNILTQIDRGTISVEVSKEQITISYQISFRLLLIISVLLVVFGIGTALASTGISLPYKLALMTAAWLWLFGMNWLIAIVRYPTFVERIAKRVKIR